MQQGIDQGVFPSPRNKLSIVADKLTQTVVDAC
jgi:hypothetical protein